MNLLIVESPNKVAKIKGFLGAGWEVAASVGHIRDLPKEGLGINKDAGYQPNYVVSEGKHKVISNLKDIVGRCGKQNVYLGADPDREGEGICFHLCAVLGLNLKTTHRVTFQEITAAAVLAAVRKPRTVDLNLVMAQESRRVIDRLVGYEISPILWKKLENVRSAGRVQSPAVRLIVEREREIAGFASKFSFGVVGEFLTPKGEVLKARRTKTLPDGESAQAYLRSTQGQRYAVRDVTKKQVEKTPPAAYSTSTLQQDGVKKLKLTVQRVSELAQALFESGDVTYIRTDSVNLSDAAIAEAAGQITGQFGQQYLHERRFKNKEGAQEAHEAIRPTHWNVTTAGSTDEQQRLYKLIYNRALASQMSAARFDETKVTLASQLPEDEFTTTTRVLTFDGYLRVYQDAVEEDQEEETAVLTYPVRPGDTLNVQQLEARQTYSKPPRRYNEGTLVEELEKRQIGRPSTYASIMNTITAKHKYVTTGNALGRPAKAVTYRLAGGKITQHERIETIGGDKAKLLPTEAGTQLIAFLEASFGQVIDYKFTADCEGVFDQIAQGTNSYQRFVPAFDAHLHKLLVAAEAKYKDLPDASNHQVGELEGFAVTAHKGKFGTYVKYRELFCNIEHLKPEQVTLAVAQAAIAAKVANGRREIGKYQGKLIVVGKSEKGTYIQWDKQYFNPPAGTEPREVTEAMAQQLIMDSLAKKAAAAAKPPVATIGKYKIYQGEKSLYVTDGKDKANLFPSVTIEQAAAMTEKECQAAIKKFLDWKKKQGNK